MNKLKIILHSKIFWLIFIIGIILNVLIRTQLITYHSNYPNDIKNITGKITKLKIDGDKVSIQLKTNKELVVATYYVASAKEKEEIENNLQIGSIVKLEGEKQEIRGLTIFNTFDYSKYLYHNHIYLSFKVNSLEYDNTKLTFIDKLKNIVNKRCENLKRSDYLKAFILGDKNDFALETKEIIKNNGVSHLFALSGMHVNFVFAFLKKLKVKNIIIYLFLILYFIISGCSISFLRALLFLLLLHLNKKFDLKLDNIPILFLIAGIILIKDPFTIYNYAFLYTFIITFSLLLYSKYFNIKNILINTILVSLITFIFSLPITISLNYEINIMSPFFNIILIPLVSTIIFPLTLLYFIIPFLEPIFILSITILEKINLLFNSISLIIVIGKITLGEIILFYSVLISLMIKKQKWLSIMLILIIILFKTKYLLDSNYYVYYLDVGQGDSALLLAPGHKEAVLIDTGGQIEYPKKDYQIKKQEFDLTENIALFIKSLGLKKIDLLILTHGDYDHAGYTLKLKEKIKIKQVIFNKDNKNTLEKEISEVIVETKTINLKHFKFQVLNTNLYDNENDNSQVIYTILNKTSFLFMGDASTKVENDLLKKYDLNHVDILKVGHHGSDTSTSQEFIKKIKPQYSIISVGKNNRYGHPKKEVLNNLNNSKIYRTDLNGSIMFKINVKYVKIKPCIS